MRGHVEKQCFGDRDWQRFRCRVCSSIFFRIGLDHYEEGTGKLRLKQARFASQVCCQSLGFPFFLNDLLHPGLSSLLRASGAADHYRRFC